MIEKISIQEFRETGALWWVNQQLHLFGMVIVVEPKTGKMYPAKCKYRGFDEKTQDNGYKNLTAYMAKNIETLQKDVME